MNYVSDYALECLTMEQANKFLTPMAKKRWVDLHNDTAHVYDYWCGVIRKVPAEGWWY